jgi:CRISPR-associated endoribonuclease Cas6
MPHSLVLNLLPVAPIPSQFLTGRHLHALFLNLVSAVDSDLSAYLHDQSQEKAFTLSPFQVSRKEAYRSSTPQPQKRVLPPASRTISRRPYSGITSKQFRKIRRFGGEFLCWMTVCSIA